MIKEAVSLYFSLTIRTHLLLSAPHAHTIEVEVMFTTQTNTGLTILKLVSADGATNSIKMYSSWIPKSFS